MNGGGCRKPSWAAAAVLISVSLLMLTFRGASSSQKMTQTAMAHATATGAGPGPGPSLTDNFPGFQAVADFLASEHAHVWILSLVGSVVVGLSGVFPLLVIPIEAGAALKTEGKTWLGVTCNSPDGFTMVFKNIYFSHINGGVTAWESLL